ncbi:MAG TPA: hypothetical protein VN030_15145 [Cellvibrio sp.]|nr:hypothetical protein [Cellvibrio sp.]
MNNRPQASLVNRILTPSVFLLAGIAALVWFSYRLYVLLYNADAAVILVDKGSYYMLGVGLGLLDLALVIIWEQWLLRSLNRKSTAIFSRVAIGSVVLLLAVPQAIHYWADRQLTAKGYSVCEAASHQWLFVQDIVYIQALTECSKNLIAK